MAEFAPHLAPDLNPSTGALIPASCHWGVQANGYMRGDSINLSVISSPDMPIYVYGSGLQFVACVELTLLRDRVDSSWD